MDLGDVDFQVGDWLVEPSRNRVSRGEEGIRLEPRTMAALVCLATHPGELVSKQDLVDRVWQVEAVADSSLTRTVAEIRKALGDDARDPQFIETVTKRGYRLVAEVTIARPTTTGPTFLDEDHVGEVERQTCVARESELARLDGYLTEALAGSGRVALVSGEAGTGKTVLVRELAWRATGTHGRLVVAAASCSAHTGVGDPFAPLRRLLGQLTGDLETAFASGAISREQARRLWDLAPQTIERVVTSGCDLVETLLPGAELLERARAAAPGAGWLEGLERLVERKTSLPPDVSLQQRAVVGQVVKVVLSVARQRPLLLVVDDLHWSDGGSIGLLFELARELAGSPLLVVGTYRPEEVWVGRGGERHPLGPLLDELKRSAGEVTIQLHTGGDREFVEELVDSEPNRLGRGFRDTLYRRTEGYALFTVETLRSLQERGMIAPDPKGRWVEGERLDWEVLPARVEGVVGGRIERLDSELRDLLAVASVEGAEFTAEVVARVRGLEARDVIRLLGREPEQRHRLVSARSVRALAGGRLSLYGFSHVLFQRYLYGRLDPAERAYLHEDVGAALEALYGDDTEEIAVDLAHHFEQAGITDKAIRYLQQAGQSCVHRTANREALGHFQRALELLATLPESDHRDRTELGLQLAIQAPLIAVQSWAGPDVARAVERAQDLAERAGDDTQRGWVLYLTGSLYTSNGRIPEAEGLAERLGDLARSMGDDTFALMARLMLGYSKAYTGRHEEGRAVLDQVLASYDESRHRWIAHAAGSDPGVFGTAHLAWLLARMGFLDQCMERIEQGLDLAERLSYRVSLCMALGIRFYCHLYRRELDLAAPVAELVLTLATEHGFVHWVMYARSWQSILLIARGTHGEGVTRLAEQMDGLRRIGLEFGRIIHLCWLAAGQLGAGRIDEALATLDEALEHLEIQGDHFYESEVHRRRGEVLQATGATPEAEAAYLRAIDVARKQKARYFELVAATALARLWRDQGRRREALDVLQPVYDWFTEGLDTAPLVEARALLDELA